MRKLGNKLTKTELQQRQIVVLDEIHRFCEEKKIKYMLAYGTLIGAIRHKGFIPWDDDVDVMMPRPDYECFIKEYKDNPQFGIATYKSEIFHASTFGRLYDKKTINVRMGSLYYGVNVDIYPIDGAPCDDNLWKIQMNDVFKLNKKRKLLKKIIKLTDYTFLPESIKNFFAVKLKNILSEKSDIDKRYDYAESSLVSFICTSDFIRFKKEYFEKCVKVKFEGKHYYAPAGFDSYLREYYGDYMQLPPEEKRIPYHKSNYFWVNYYNEKHN